MKDTTLVVAGMATLAAGTYAFRLSGQLLRARISFPPRAEKLLEGAAVVLLAALVATTALTEGHGFAGIARPVGVLVGGLLAWRKAPFLVVVIAAAATTAVLRLLGVHLGRPHYAPEARTACLEAVSTPAPKSPEGRPRPGRPKAVRAAARPRCRTPAPPRVLARLPRAHACR